MLVGHQVRQSVAIDVTHFQDITFVESRVEVAPVVAEGSGIVPIDIKACCRAHQQVCHTVGIEIRGN